MGRATKDTVCCTKYLVALPHDVGEAEVVVYVSDSVDPIQKLLIDWMRVAQLCLFTENPSGMLSSIISAVTGFTNNVFGLGEASLQLPRRIISRQIWTRLQS